MPIMPVYGHTKLRALLLERVRGGSLPASLLLHGSAGVGKQRLALWLGQALLCENDPPPCGACQHCRYSLALSHPDLTWVFPRPRPKDADAAPEEIAADLAEEAAARAARGGVYLRPPGTEAIYVATVRMVLRRAAMAPALGRRKVFVIGDAERMVPQEGSEQAANAFLKLLEEPPRDTYVILTSSEPAALLPTIRSRVAAVRVKPLTADEIHAFVADPAVEAALEEDREVEALVAASAGAPGTLFGESARAAAMTAARRLAAAAYGSDQAAVYEAALSQSIAGARGGFSETLEAVTVVLAERTRNALRSGDEQQARRGVRGIDAVEVAKGRADGNINPQLLAWRLLRDLREAR
jgi:DNA polymerase III subunit delta'